MIFRSIHFLEVCYLAFYVANFIILTDSRLLLNLILIFLVHRPATCRCAWSCWPPPNTSSSLFANGKLTNFTGSRIFKLKRYSFQAFCAQKVQFSDSLCKKGTVFRHFSAKRCSFRHFLQKGAVFRHFVNIHH